MSARIDLARRSALRAMALTCACAAGAARASPRIEPPPIGTAIEIPSVRLLDGRTLAPEYWRGKVVVVELWASWCPFCAKQNPEIDRLHRANAEHGLEVLALSIDRDPENAKRYMHRHGYAFHAAMFDEAWQRLLGRPRALPVVWVIGRDGRLAQVELGEMFPEDVAQLARWRTR